MAKKVSHSRRPKRPKRGSVSRAKGLKKVKIRTIVGK